MKPDSEVNELDEILRQYAEALTKITKSVVGNPNDSSAWLDANKFVEVPLRAKLRQLIHTKTVEAEDNGIKRGFYAGQAMARVELEDCHRNWKKWNEPDELQALKGNTWNEKN